MFTPSHILHHENGLLVLNKPAGLPTAGDHLDQPGSLQFELIQHLGRMVWAVHQLDKGTSGINLFVTKKRMVSTFSDVLRTGQKRYLALVQGHMRHARRRVREPIGWVPALKRWAVSEDGKRAETRIAELARGETSTFIEAVIKTGRTHQVRVHCAHLGHPLIGDTRYGTARSGPPLLHAQALTTEKGTWEAPLPPHFIERLHLEKISPDTKNQQKENA